MGKNPIGDITKKATKLLKKGQANAPLIHQQASLAQNVRVYLEKRKHKKGEF